MKYIEESCLDDILMQLFKYFLENNHTLVKATKGDSKEVFGALIELTNPRARLSRSELKGTPYSCIGELCWYLSGSGKLSHMQYYIPRYDEFSDDGETVHGAYGPRLLKMHEKYNQIDRVVDLLSRKRSSRRAVIQIFDASDLSEDYKDIPCTTTLQFVIRDNKLDMMVHMRSNDIYLGLPHDIFCFTMLQEIISNKLQVSLGVYKHSVGSLHLYETDFDNASKYVNEGWHRQLPMKPMPSDNIQDCLNLFLDIEKNIRIGNNLPANSYINDYWNDLIGLLFVFNISKTSKNLKEIINTKQKIKDENYHVYIDKLLAKLTA